MLRIFILFCWWAFWGLGLVIALYILYDLWIAIETLGRYPWEDSRPILRKIKKNKEGKKIMTNILVTGGGGFIGHHLARYLLKPSNDVRVADIELDQYCNRKENHYANEYWNADLRNLKACENVLKDIDIVFNLAANMGGIGYITSVGAEVMRDNVLINTNMLEACRKSKTVEKIFFSSSACVYPTFMQEDAKVNPLKEADAIPADPDNYYGWEKLFTERMMSAYHDDHNLNIRIARFHNIYGPEGAYEGGKEKSPAAICRKVISAKDGNTITIWGDGKQTRSYCYITDCIRGIMELMKSDVQDPLNIGSDNLVSIESLTQRIIRLSGKSLEIGYDLTKPQGVRGRNADLTKVKSLLDWAPKVKLNQGLKMTYDWIQKDMGEY